MSVPSSTKLLNILQVIRNKILCGKFWKQNHFVSRFTLFHTTCTPAVRVLKVGHGGHFIVYAAWRTAMLEPASIRRSSFQLPTNMFIHKFMGQGILVCLKCLEVEHWTTTQLTNTQGPCKYFGCLRSIHGCIWMRMIWCSPKYWEFLWCSFFDVQLYTFLIKSAILSNPPKTQKLPHSCHRTPAWATLLSIVFLDLALFTCRKHPETTL